MEGLVVLAVSACLSVLTVLLVIRSLVRRDPSTAPRDLLREEWTATHPEPAPTEASGSDPEPPPAPGTARAPRGEACEL